LRIDRDIAAGLFFMVLGAVGLYIGADYAFGTSARMGAGLVPKLLCGVLLGLGCLITLKGIAAGSGPVEAWAFGPLAFILAAVLAFGAYLESLGLKGATVSAVLAAGTGRTRPGRMQMALLGVAMACLVAVLLPGFARKVGPVATSSLLAVAGAALVAHIVIYARSECLRALCALVLLAVVLAVLAVLAVIVFVDFLGLTFKSLLVLWLWQPVKAALVIPILQAMRSLFFLVRS
jgi:hypothetical protein